MCLKFQCIIALTHKITVFNFQTFKMEKPMGTQDINLSTIVHPVCSLPFHVELQLSSRKLTQRPFQDQWRKESNLEIEVSKLLVPVEYTINPATKILSSSRILSFWWGIHGVFHLDQEISLTNSSQISSLEVKIMRMQRSIAVQHRWNLKVARRGWDGEVEGNKWSVKLCIDIKRWQVLQYNDYIYIW